MPFDLPVGYKFSCFALEGVSREGRRDPLDLSDGLWVVFEPPFELSEGWEDWLGEIQIKKLEQCNLGLLAISPSANPGALDNENNELNQRVLSLFYALFMVEIFDQNGGIGLSGANVGGRVEVRQVQRLENHYPPDRFEKAILTKNHFIRMARIAEGIRAVHVPGTPATRFQRGLHAWIRAVQEPYGDERLHQFVRAIEAVVKPSEGKVKKQFVYRGQLFVGESALNEAMLYDIVNMRGSTEHLNHMEEALGKYPAANRKTIAQQRLCQVQLLASYIYEQILCDADLRALFTSDDRITAFWQLRPAERRAQWPGHLEWVRWIAARYQL